MSVYCLDTNAFIQPWNKWYPMDVFPSFWERLDQWGQDGLVIAPEEVLNEIHKIDDDLHEWTKQRHFIFKQPEEDVQEALLKILAQFPRLVDTVKSRHMADPWVIAQAQVTSAIVISEEVRSSGSKSPKIPDVCDSLRIPCKTTLDMIRDMGLKF